MSPPLEVLDKYLWCVCAGFTNCTTSFKPQCTKRYVPTNGWGNYCNYFFLPFSVWLYFFTINRVPYETCLKHHHFSRFVMVPGAFAPERATRSRTCADTIQPCWTHSRPQSLCFFWSPGQGHCETSSTGDENVLTIFVFPVLDWN